jgi:hypothetical protein
MIETEKCQNHCVPRISVGKADTGKIPFSTHVRLFLKRRLPSGTKRKLKQRFNPVFCFFRRRTSKRSTDTAPLEETKQASSNLQLKPGDLVKVKTLDEIKATLDGWNELRGCMFMDAMAEYCGTTQQVLQPVERFVDERDYRVKKARGITLLVGLVCHGTPGYGRCDRACYYFWRNEWLEKIDR